MSDELEINLGQPNAQRPPASMPAPRVLVARTVLRQVNSHLAGDVGVERGGVLVGHFVDHDNTVQITGQIAADHAQATRDSFTFTHETWVAIGDKLESEFPGQQMVGWYHSHPNFGIFLSAHDKFIQTNFFSAPWHLAYVADPIRKELGFFGWHAGEIGPIAEWDLVDEPPAAGTTVASAPPMPSRRSEQAFRTRWTRRTWTSILLICSAAMVLAGLWLLLPLDNGPSTIAATTITTLPASEAAASTVADVATTSSAAPTTIISAPDATTPVSSPSTVSSGSVTSPWRTERLAAPSAGFAVARADSPAAAPDCSQADVVLSVQRLEPASLLVARRSGDDLRFDGACDDLAACENFVGRAQDVPWALPDAQLVSCDGSGQTKALAPSIAALASVPRTGVLTWVAGEGLGAVSSIDEVASSPPPVPGIVDLATDCTDDPDRAVGPQCSTLVSVDDTSAVVARSEAGAPIVVVRGVRLQPCSGTTGVWSWANGTVAVPIAIGQVLFVRAIDGIADALLEIEAGAESGSALSCSLTSYGAQG